MMGITNYVFTIRQSVTIQYTTVKTNIKTMTILYRKLFIKMMRPRVLRITIFLVRMFLKNYK